MLINHAQPDITSAAGSKVGQPFQGRDGNTHHVLQPLVHHSLCLHTAIRPSPADLGHLLPGRHPNNLQVQAIFRPKHTKSDEAQLC